MAIGNTNIGKTNSITKDKIKGYTLEQIVEKNLLTNEESITVWTESTTLGKQIKDEIDSLFSFAFYGYTTIKKVVSEVDGKINYFIYCEQYNSGDKFVKTYTQINSINAWSDWVWLGKQTTTKVIIKSYTLDQIVSKDLLADGETITIWCESTTLGKQIKDEIDKKFNTSFYGYCTIRKVINEFGKARNYYLYAEQFNIGTKYTKTYTQLNNVNKWSEWVKIC